MLYWRFSCWRCSTAFILPRYLHMAAAKNNDLTDCLKKLELVDEVCRKLLTDEARELLDSDPVEPVEAIMQAAGLRG